MRGVCGNEHCALTPLRRNLILSGLALVLCAAAAFTAPPAAAAPQCVPLDTTGEPTLGYNPGPQAPAYFAPDFPAIADQQLGYRIGGFGGLKRRAKLRHTPVVFVHGNQADAQNWLDVMLQFQNDADYSLQEMYALSYNGLGNYYAGAPVATPPTQEDTDYIAQNSTVLDNGGHGAADDDNVADLCRFVEAVQSYTGSTQIDLVGHSLGVTLARKFLTTYPQLAKDVVAFVGIAGANHGTTVCRGLDTSYYGCNEIAPGTAWLDALNGPDGSLETYGPTHWMTVYNGLEGDPFFVGPDEPSPQLRGADNRTFPGAYHNDLRVGPAEVDTYLPFLLREGQAGPGAARDGAGKAAQIEAEQPDGVYGSLCGVSALTGPVVGCIS
jgi:pimeloyl-ACP methyl ester carboxylesterase